ncbi:MAG: DUF417 family protein [Pasteurellaceae bacterium]|nr:DUF417 family protein [Pasteurellaceae bacterium]
MQKLLDQFRHSNLDMVALRLSVIIIFLVFGTMKWFDFEVEILKPMISPTWLNFLYDLFGYHGASYFLGVVEGLAYISLILGFSRPLWGILGGVLVLGTAVVTLSMLPQLGFDAFIFKDILLIGAALVLIKNDLNRFYATKSA